MAKIRKIRSMCLLWLISQIKWHRMVKTFLVIIITLLYLSLNSEIIIAKQYVTSPTTLKSGKYSFELSISHGVEKKPNVKRLFIHFPKQIYKDFEGEIEIKIADSMGKTICQKKQNCIIDYFNRQEGNEFILKTPKVYQPINIMIRLIETKNGTKNQYPWDNVIYVPGARIKSMHLKKDGTIKLSWDKVKGAKYYQIYVFTIDRKEAMAKGWKSWKCISKKVKGTKTSILYSVDAQQTVFFYIRPMKVRIDDKYYNARKPHGATIDNSSELSRFVIKE